MGVVGTVIGANVVRTSMRRQSTDGRLRQESNHCNACVDPCRHSNDERLRRTSDVGSFIDAVAVVTRLDHFDSPRKALENGKHVSSRAFHRQLRKRELIELANRKRLKIMVDHTSVHGAVRRMKQIIDGGLLGDLYYYRSTRVNLGCSTRRQCALGPAPHDLSVMDYLIKRSPSGGGRVQPT